MALLNKSFLTAYYGHFVTFMRGSVLNFVQHLTQSRA